MMLKRLYELRSGVTVKIGEAAFPQPIPSGLEFNPPSRGVWNIVHTGMLMPESHQIFICARGCLRGVILTAAEMNAMDRFSWVDISENDFFDGSLESNIVEGVTEIIPKLRKRPAAVLVFLSCVQLFAGIDFPQVIGELETRFPDIDFVECFMNPTMRKSGLTPDQLMRRQLYAPVQKLPVDPALVNLTGCDFLTDRESDFYAHFRENGLELSEIRRCRNYKEFLRSGSAFLNISTIPAARVGGEILAARLGIPHLYWSQCYDAAGIEANFAALAKMTGKALPDLESYRIASERDLADALKLIGDTPIAIDYTAVPRILSLTRLLLEKGFNIDSLYADVFLPEEKEDFIYLQKNHPEVKVLPTVAPEMRFAVESGRKTLAIGQKAAFYSRTPHFVNMVAGGGFLGYSAISRITVAMKKAFLEEACTRSVIQHKGLECESCI